MKVEIIIETKEGKGYRKPMETTETTRVEMVVEVGCFAEAQRMARAIFPNRDEFEYFDMVCID